MMLLKDLADKANVKFGTSGVRGLVKDLTPELCFAYASAFIEGHKQTKKIAIGHDLRPSSPDITKACIAAAKFHDIEAIYLGNMPTPALANFCLLRNVPGIVVTGSHIPFDRNGIKFYRPDGEISKDDELNILNTEIDLPEFINLEELPSADNEGIVAYKDRYLNFFGEDFLDGMLIGIYEHSSVARDFMHELFSSLGAKTISLGRTNEFKPIDTEAVRQDDIDRAINWAKNFTFDLLVSTDGDADRPLIGDENGMFIKGDVIGVLTAKYLKLDHVVTPLTSNSLLEKSKLFRSTRRTKVGSPYVIEGMMLNAKLNKDLVGGYEANGGFLLGSNVIKNSRMLPILMTRDAILPILSIIGLSKELNLPVSRIATTLPKRYMVSTKIENFSKENYMKMIRNISKSTKSIIKFMMPSANSITETTKVDGFRVVFDTEQIVHLRPSGNAPELRIYIEDSTEENAIINLINVEKKCFEYV